MADRPCPGHKCGADLAPGIILCGGCIQRQRNRLRWIPSLLDDLDEAMAKMLSAGDGGDGDGGRLDFDPIASDAALAIRTSVHRWVHVWDDETPQRPSVMAREQRALSLRTIAGQCGLLAGAQLASRPWVAAMAEDIRKVTEAGGKAVDKPDPKAFVGWCPTCPNQVALYATENDVLVRCRSCGVGYNVQASKDALLAAADHEHAPAAILARALHLDPALIRQWRKRGKLEAIGVNLAGQPLYRVSDVQRLKANSPATVT